jgi:uncharacterized membrane protein YfhO
VVITGTAPDLGQGSAAESASVDRVDVIGFEAERAVLRSTSGRPGLLVLADANYPGWSAAVDGQPAPILQANLLFRAVPVPAGTHEVTFTYQPANWPRGLAISLAALGLLVLALAWSLLPPRR